MQREEGDARKDIEIAIIGAGPAGLSAWLHLNTIAPELAAKASVFDKAEHPRDKLCGGGVTAIGGMLLRGIGIELRCTAVPVTRVEFRYGEHVQALEQPGVIAVVRRREFDHALAKVAIERGVDLRQGEAFVGAEQDGDRLRVRTTRGEYRVRVLVGADGAQSAVRHALDLDDEARLSRLIEVVSPVDHETAPEFAGPTAIFDFAPMAHGVQGYTWHFPCVEGNTAAVNRGIYDSRVHPERPRADLRTVFAATLAGSGLDPATAEWKAAPLRWFSPAGALSRPNALLIGDAAGVDPFLGEGISPSLDYGDLAARLIEDAYERGDFSFTDMTERLIEHPVGRLLDSRRALAHRAYGDVEKIGPRLPEILRGWAGTKEW